MDSDFNVPSSEPVLLSMLKSELGHCEKQFDFPQWLGSGDNCIKIHCEWASDTLDS